MKDYTGTAVLYFILGMAIVSLFFVAYFAGEAHVASLVQKFKYVFDF